MKPKTKQPVKEEHLAKAKADSLSVSTKHCIELCRYLRYKTITQAKQILEEVITLKKPIPFLRFKRNIGHKPGIAAGRFPQKAAQGVLKLVKSVEANAQFKGLNTSNLKITKILANRASIPLTGGRQRTATKRTHLEIEVIEKKEKKKTPKKQADKKEEPKTLPQTELTKEKDSSTAETPTPQPVADQPAPTERTEKPAPAGKEIKKIEKPEAPENKTPEPTKNKPLGEKKND